jgi:hypothetical protein
VESDYFWRGGRSSPKRTAEKNLSEEATAEGPWRKKSAKIDEGCAFELGQPIS